MGTWYKCPRCGRPSHGVTCSACGTHIPGGGSAGAVDRDVDPLAGARRQLNPFAFRLLEEMRTAPAAVLGEMIQELDVWLARPPAAPAPRAEPRTTLDIEPVPLPAESPALTPDLRAEYLFLQGVARWYKKDSAGARSDLRAALTRPSEPTPAVTSLARGLLNSLDGGSR
jgi:hypothetical protein